MDNENKIYTIEIAGQKNSFTVSGLTMNGTNYVSKEEVDTSNWPSVFSFTAMDEDGNITESCNNAKLVQQESYDWDEGKFYLAFTRVSEEELLRAQIATMKEDNTNMELALCEVYEMMLGGAQ